MTIKVSNLNLTGMNDLPREKAVMEGVVGEPKMNFPGGKTGNALLVSPRIIFSPAVDNSKC